MHVGVDLDQLHPSIKLGQIDDYVGTSATQMQVLDTQFSEKPVALAVNLAGVIFVGDWLPVVDAVENFIQLESESRVMANSTVVVEVMGFDDTLRLLLKALTFERRRRLQRLDAV